MTPASRKTTDLDGIGIDARRDCRGSDLPPNGRQKAHRRRVAEIGVDLLFFAQRQIVATDSVFADQGDASEFKHFSDDLMVEHMMMQAPVHKVLL